MSNTHTSRRARTILLFTVGVFVAGIIANLLPAKPAAAMGEEFNWLGTQVIQMTGGVFDNPPDAAGDPDLTAAKTSLNFSGSIANGKFVADEPMMFRQFGFPGFFYDCTLYLEIQLDAELYYQDNQPVVVYMPYKGHLNVDIKKSGCDNLPEGGNGNTFREFLGGQIARPIQIGNSQKVYPALEECVHLQGPTTDPDGIVGLCIKKKLDPNSKDPVQEGLDTGLGQGPAKVEPDPCEENAFLGAIICEAVTGMQKLLGLMVSSIAGYAQFSLYQPVTGDQVGKSGVSQPTYAKLKTAWQTFARLASLIIVAAFLFMIIASSAAGRS